MSNVTTPEQERDAYLKRVDGLYAQVRKWVEEFDPTAEISEENLTLYEEPVAPYQAKVLVIKRPTYKPVRLIPRGKWILGAEGRVDLKSDLGTETLVYVSEDVPTISIDRLTESGKVLEERMPNSLPNNDVAKGWVFVQNRQIGMLPTLDADLFRRLLEVLGR